MKAVQQGLWPTNKCKELLTTKLQFKEDKNPTWRGSWMLLDALFPVEKGLLARPWRMLWKAIENSRS
jgi:hypothetical protein